MPPRLMARTSVLPKGKTLAEAEFTSAEHFNYRRVARRYAARNPMKKPRQMSWFFIGGPEEIRTPDPYNANVVRSQLRYRPVRWMLCRPCSALRNICQLCYYTKSFLKCKGVI